MGAPLRALIVEDNENDCQLVLRELRHGGYDVAWERVQTTEAMAGALDRGGWDIILSDFRMPAFSAPAALALCRSRGLDLPFIIVSGTIGEEQAVESLKAGAHDFLLKQKLARLCPAVSRELRDADERRARRRAETEKRAAEERYRTLVEQIPAVLYIAEADAIGRVLYVGPQIEDLLGHPATEWVEDPDLWNRLTHPEDMGRAHADFERLRSTVVSSLTSEYRMLSRSGRVVWVRDQAQLVFWSGAPVPVVQGILVNITDQKRAEEELRKEQQLAEVVLDSVEAGIVACDREGRLTLFNRAALDFHGLPPEPIPPEEWSDHYDLFEADGQSWLKKEDVPLYRALGGEIVSGLEIVIRPKQRPSRTMLCSGRAILDERGRKLGAVVAMHDITERKQAEEDARRQRDAHHQTEKLAAMGQLLSGVAHELNNPLAVLMGHASLLRRAAGAAHLGARVEKIEKAAERCSRIVRNFLALARNRPPERQAVSATRVIEEAVEFAAYPLRVDGIDVRLDLSCSLPTLWGDAHQLQQVIVNLLTNAHHALNNVPPPRTVTIATRHDPAAQRVVIEVADTGPGIPSGAKARIFDPFFTTKGLGEGTGLGLSLCRDIVTSHGGTLSVESEPGRGALFRIDLPAGVPAGALPDSDATQPRGDGARSILVVDDEAAVAEVVAELIRAEGHEVEIAEGGRAALDKLDRAAYDLVLADVRMPGLDGPGLYREAARRHPGIAKRFVFLTGDALASETRQFLDESGAPSLAKPFDAAQLHRALVEACTASTRA